MEYRESDLVLEVSKNADPAVWDEGKYADFFDILFRNRNYQKEAAETVLRYLNSGEYHSLEELARENYGKNEAIRERFHGNLNAFLADLGLPGKLSGTVDLATGTGKSYLMYAIAVCMLAEHRVDRVLVLTPSVTIESELTLKFRDLAANDRLNAALGETYVPPAVINGDETIVENSIVIENRDAIYKSRESHNSIVDSLAGRGERTLVLNDEVHHVFYSEGNQWKYFIEDEGKRGIDFRYVIGFTGTAYRRRNQTGDANEYLSDVLYRYSLRRAIEEGFVKDVEYIDKADMPSDPDERWQVILDSHEQIAGELERLNGMKPVTIIVTGEKRTAEAQARKFKAFLSRKRNLSQEDADNIVLCVHSGNSAANDRLKLKDVDSAGNGVEFIFSVSMLTEGWDVKRVFQIVPDEERAFNSKLLIAQVLGRGLRRPEGWQSEWGVPKVTVFNHEKWAPRVKSLVDELLDFKKCITTGVNEDSPYHFELLNVSYEPTETSVTRTESAGPMTFLEEGYVKLPTDSENRAVEVEWTDIRTGGLSNRRLRYSSETYTVRSVAEAMYDRFADLSTDEKRDYYRELWPVDKLEQMIRDSLQRSSNQVITKKIRNTFLKSMNVLFRDYSRAVTYESVPARYEVISTKTLQSVRTELSALKRNRVLFYSGAYGEGELDDASRESLAQIEDTINSYKHRKIENVYLFKTPQDGIVTTGEPETAFVKRLLERDTVTAIDSFVKSNDTGFYHLEYTWRKGTHQQNGQFNPDFFIKKGNVIVVVEIKDDAQISRPDAENIGKYRAAEKHFERINDYWRQRGEERSYKMTFLSPRSYDRFFEKLVDGDAGAILNFNSDLDVRLSQGMETRPAT